MPTAKTPRCCFNSRTLGRVRQEGEFFKLLPWGFQFTHPGKGATQLRRSRDNDEHNVSIHAPWEGCDPRRLGQIDLEEGFNSRTLGRVRPVGRHRLPHTLVVSIHAPWEGCDLLLASWMKSSSSFNSRTLGRVRPAAPLPSGWVSPTFQFTHPGKGATMTSVPSPASA